jgi:hypothetical protein
MPAAMVFHSSTIAGVLAIPHRVTDVAPSNLVEAHPGLVIQYTNRNLHLLLQTNCTDAFFEGSSYSGKGVDGVRGFQPNGVQSNAIFSIRKHYSARGDGSGSGILGSPVSVVRGG